MPVDTKYYDYLGVNSDATEKQIKTAYRKKCVKYHPDKHVGATDKVKFEMEEKFKNIARAYQVLSDKEKRKIYLTLNPSKYRDITIPDLNGRSNRQAITQLQSIGFKIGEFSYVPDIGKDVVRGSKSDGKKLRPGAKLAKNAIIDLILGEGKRR